MRVKYLRAAFAFWRYDEHEDCVLAATVPSTVLAVVPDEERFPAAVIFADTTFVPDEPVPSAREPHADQQHPVPQDMGDLPQDVDDVLHGRPPR